MSKKKSILVQLPPETLARLETLCEVNARSRPNLLTLLIDNAYTEYAAKPDSARVSPVVVGESDD